MLCAGWNWLSGSEVEVEDVKNLRMDRKLLEKLKTQVS